MRTIESMAMEIAKLKQGKAVILEDYVRLQRQRVEDLEELTTQADLIIDLYSKLNNSKTNLSPLKIAG